METRVTAQMPESLLNILQSGCPALLLTIGAEGFPHTAYTWAVAVEASKVRFAADLGSTTLANLNREQRASLQIIAEGDSIFLIKGAATQIKSQIESSPIPMAMMALEVVTVKDQSWPAVSVQPLAYQWSSDKRQTMQAVELAVYAEMREWQD